MLAFGHADAAGVRYGSKHRQPFTVRIKAWRPDSAQYIDRTKLRDFYADRRIPDISLLQRVSDAFFEFTQRKIDCVNTTDDWQPEIATLINS